MQLINNLIRDKYVVWGYMVSVAGTSLFLQIGAALLLGFVGAFGGWLFEKFRKKYIDKDGQD